MGGGTGLPVVLRGLRRAMFPLHDGPVGQGDRELLTGIVTVADDGGSSGRLRLWPEGARALPAACEAIRRANLIVLGPGSLFTSLIPVLLVGEVTAAVAASRAAVVLVLNLMTEPGETDGYGAFSFIAALRRHAPQVTVHYLLHNTAPIRAARRRLYADEGAAPIPVDETSVRAFGCDAIGRDLLAAGPLARHDPDTLARAIVELAGGGPPPRKVPA